MSELAEDPQRMRTLKKVLNKTETELYVLEGDVPEDLKKAYEADQEIVEGRVLDPDQPVLDLEKMINELEEAKQNYPPEERQRWDAFAMRLQGFSVQDIAMQYDKSVPLIYLYLDWCAKQLPKLKDYIQEFTVVSMQRLEVQYRQLGIARAKGDLLAHKVSLDIIDQQAKLAGAHKVSIEVDNRVTYVLEGVDMDKL